MKVRNISNKIIGFAGFGELMPDAEMSLPDSYCDSVQMKILEKQNMLLFIPEVVEKPVQKEEKPVQKKRASKKKVEKEPAEVPVEEKPVEESEAE